MASLTHRADSKFWWVCYLDEHGKRQRKSTGYLLADSDQTHLAKALKAEFSRREHLMQAAANCRADERDEWELWVEPFLAKHCPTARTLERYRGAWKQVHHYLVAQGLHRPKSLDYKGVLGFIDWRSNQLRSSGKKISLNTALNDVRTLRVIMRQAIRRGFVAVNPCERMGVARKKTKRKPELSDDDISTIRELLKDCPAWMNTSFEIALNTGCRISETQIDFQHIDFERKTITFAKPKGGEERAFTIPLPDAISGRLRELKSSGAAKTLTLPALASKAWWQFFGRMGRSDLCFHCTRVTFVTRLFRAGVPMAAAMKLVNHSSELVHKIYQRLGVEDVRQFANVVNLPAAVDPSAPGQLELALVSSAPRISGAKRSRRGA